MTTQSPPQVCATSGGPVCPQCTRRGLPILFGRYAVAYSEDAKQMARLDELQPKHPLQAMPDGIRLEKAKYSVRMLRAGYLYILIERTWGIQWLVYSVSPQGHLLEVSKQSSDMPAAGPPCARGGRLANHSLAWIDDPNSILACWYLFNPGRIDDALLLDDGIQREPAKFMQRLDIQAWRAGNRTQRDTALPQDLDETLLDYAALEDESLQQASTAFKYGLMGGNPDECGWGDVEEFRPGYRDAHGERLNGMRQWLLDHNGVVAICEDALGITQEFSHLFTEIAIPYKKWQKQQAEGLASSVTNEWAFETVIDAESLVKLLCSGAVQSKQAWLADREKAIESRPRINPDIEQWKQIVSREEEAHKKRLAEALAKERKQWDDRVKEMESAYRGVPELESLGEPPADIYERRRWESQRRRALQREQRRQSHSQAKTQQLEAIENKMQAALDSDRRYWERRRIDGEKETANREGWRQDRQQTKAQILKDTATEIRKTYAKNFDIEAAERVKAAQAKAWNAMQEELSRFGQEHNAWLQSANMQCTLLRYSCADEKIDLAGGGAALALDLIDSLSGCVLSEAGNAYLDAQDLDQDNLLTRAISFNNPSLFKAFCEIREESKKAVLEGRQGESQEEVPDTLLQELPEKARAALLSLRSSSKDVSYAESVASVLTIAKLDKSLAEKAIAYLDKGQQHRSKPKSSAGQLGHTLWRAILSHLLGVKMLRNLSSQPAIELEGRLIRFAAVAGLSTAGTQVENLSVKLIAKAHNALQEQIVAMQRQLDNPEISSHTRKLLQREIEAKKGRIAGTEGTIRQAAIKMEREKLKKVTHQTRVADFTPHAGSLRGAGLDVVFGLGIIILRGFQLDEKRDWQAATEMLAGIADVASALTLYRVAAMVKTSELGKNTKAFLDGRIQTLRIRAMLFLLPGSIIGAFWSFSDHKENLEQGDRASAIASLAGGIGAFSIAGGAFLGILAQRASITLLIRVAAFFLPFGTILTVAATLVLFFIYEEPWVRWLRKGPLGENSSQRYKEHESLEETKEDFYSLFKDKSKKTIED